MHAPCHSLMLQCRPDMRTARTLLTLTLLIQCTVYTTRADVTLVDKGAPRATIVLAPEASDQAREAADLLRSYVKRISGGTLHVAETDDPVDSARILVGHSKSIAGLGIDVPSGYTNDVNEEGYVIKTVGNDLILAGNEDRDYRGTVFAVYDLLDQLGCRWYFPGEYGEVIPTLDTVVVPDMDRTERPDFRYRNISYAGWMPISSDDAKRMQTWRDRNRCSRVFVSMPGDGSVSRLAPPDEYFDEHPHMYSIDRRGNRWEGMFCMTDPMARQVSIDAIKDYFREHPDVNSFGFAPADGYSPRCHCEDCTELLTGFGGKGIGEPSISDLWFNFANHIAEEVYQEFPDRHVLTNGYANRVRLPETIPEFSPNLGIQLATIHICTFHRTGDPRCWERQVYQQVLDRWTDAVDCVIIYDYDPGTAVDNLPFPALHCLKHDLPHFKEQGIWGFWTHAANSWTVTHLNYYVRAKLMWDTSFDVDNLVDDYCRRFYGPAAGPIKDYIWLLESAIEDSDIHTAWGDVIHWSHLLNPVIKDLDSRLADAEAETTHDATLAGRVHMLRLAHDHMRAYLDMEAALAQLDFRAAVDATNRMLALRDTAESIRTGMLPHTAEFAHDFRTTIEWHRTLYTELAAIAGGEQGERVADLPRHWEFKTDPRDIGVLDQWYLPGRGVDWQPIDSTLYWEAQGHADENGWPYVGKAWYRTQFDVPADAAGKPLKLTLGGVYYGNDYQRGVWTWVNGRLISPDKQRHHEMGGLTGLKPIHIDVTDDIRPGESNDVAVLVHTNHPARFPRSGMHRRSFLWSPRTAADRLPK